MSEGSVNRALSALWDTLRVTSDPRLRASDCIQVCACLERWILPPPIPASAYIGPWFVYRHIARIRRQLNPGEAFIDLIKVPDGQAALIHQLRAQTEDAAVTSHLVVEIEAGGITYASVTELHGPHPPADVVRGVYLPPGSVLKVTMNEPGAGTPILSVSITAHLLHPEASPFCC